MSEPIFTALSVYAEMVYLLLPVMGLLSFPALSIIVSFVSPKNSAKPEWCSLSGRWLTAPGATQDLVWIVKSVCERGESPAATTLRELGNRWEYGSLSYGPAHAPRG